MDLKALKEKPIAVLGAGGVGKPIAGDSALAGARVRIWDQPEFAKKTLANIEKWGIRIEGLQMNMASASILGCLIPPSGMMIVFAWVTNTSV